MPEDVRFVQDRSRRTLLRRKERFPDLIEARKRDKIAYFVVDKLVIKNRNLHFGKTKPLDEDATVSESISNENERIIDSSNSVVFATKVSMPTKRLFSAITAISMSTLNAMTSLPQNIKILRKNQMMFLGFVKSVPLTFFHLARYLMKNY